jgi:dynein heavy chain 1
VYLNGIFSSPTIRSKLGHATADFRRAETEFMGLSKAVFQKKIMKGAMFMDKVVNSLQSLHESLPRVQKKLSDCLEKQRDKFLRFFFVGDEDLLEIIGKSSAIEEIQKHLGKMFGGLTGAKTEQSQIVEMNCGAGESVKLENAVEISPTVHETLSNLKKEMRNSTSFGYRRQLTFCAS